MSTSTSHQATYMEGKRHWHPSRHYFLISIQRKLWQPRRSWHPCHHSLLAWLHLILSSAMEVMCLWRITTAIWQECWLVEGIIYIYIYTSFANSLSIIICVLASIMKFWPSGWMDGTISSFCRRYFGHKRTIRPNAKKLYSLFLNRTGMTWDAFASKVDTFQKGFMGEPNEVKPGRSEFHENPETCICGSTKEAERW